MAVGQRAGGREKGLKTAAQTANIGISWLPPNEEKRW